MDRVQNLVNASGIDQHTGILVHKPSNIFYLSGGYTGEGLLVLGHALKAIVTDFRYVEQAQVQAPGFAVHSINNEVNHAQLAARLLRDHQITAALYEDDCLTVRAGKSLQDALGDITLKPLENQPEKMRQVKDEAEIELIGKACAISSKAFELICEDMKPGMTEIQIRRQLENHLLDLGAQGTAFDTIIASGPNGSLPHAIPGERKVQKGDMITLDFGAKYLGYCADMTRTVSLGQPDKQMLEIYNIVLEAQKASQDALAPGKICQQIDSIARDMIAQKGYADRFGHGLGHGLGIDIHEDPRLSQKCQEILQPGHVVTVEPGIYLPGIGGVRIENTCVITASGARSLVDASRELRIL